jgi:hypothetical protein
MFVLTLTRLIVVSGVYADVGGSAGNPGRSRRAAPLSAGSPVSLTVT